MCSLSAVQCLSKNSQESQVTSPVKINCDVPLSRKNLRRAPRVEILASDRLLCREQIKGREGNPFHNWTATVFTEMHTLVVSMNLSQWGLRVTTKVSLDRTSVGSVVWKIRGVFAGTHLK